MNLSQLYYYITLCVSDAPCVSSQASRFTMPCFKMASNTNTNSNSGGKVSPPPALNLEFVCQAVTPTLDEPAMGEQSDEGNGDVEEDEDEEEEEEEETDMITALRNARAKAIAKAAKQLAIEDGSYVPKAKSKKGVTASTAAPAQAAQSLSYWRPDKALGGGKAVARAGSMGGSPSDLELQLLQSDLAAESVINDGEYLIEATCVY
jgi:hypothetical protein